MLLSALAAVALAGAAVNPRAASMMMRSHGEMHGSAGWSGSVIPGETGGELYLANCAACHGQDRRGGLGPPLLPSTLPQDDEFYRDTIANGRPGTAMPAWGERGLTEAQLRDLIEHLRTDPSTGR